MKTYVRPELEIELFEEKDVIVCSGQGDEGVVIDWYHPEFEDE